MIFNVPPIPDHSMIVCCAYILSPEIWTYLEDASLVVIVSGDKIRDILEEKKETA